MFAYSNNGLSYRAWNDPGNLLQGEIYFDHVPTSTELGNAFPGYAAAVAVATATAAGQTGYVTALASGLAISSTGTPAVDATYALDQSQQANVANVALYITVNNRFPGSLSSVSLRKIDGTTISIPATAVFQEIATAIADYIAKIDAQLLIAQGGGSPTWPTASVTIA